MRSALDITFDWPRILDELAHVLGEPHEANPNLRVPVSAHKLAEALGVSRGTLRGWIDGATPKHPDGEWILLRWSELTGRSRTFAPVMRRLPSAAARQCR